MPQLTPIQSQVIAGLLAGKSVSAVARENGIHRSTICQWRNEHPYFGLVLDQCRSRHQVNLYDLVQDLTEQALETVAIMLQSEDATVRLRAAQAILRIAHPGRVPKGLRAGMEMETFVDQTVAQTAKLDPPPVEEEPESDTIRHLNLSPLEIPAAPAVRDLSTSAVVEAFKHIVRRSHLMRRPPYNWLGSSQIV
jgi:transposase-like protein